MAKLFVATVATAEAATLAVTYADCGDSDTHAKVTDLQPSSITTGGTTTITGTGDLDESVTGAQFSIDIKADGVKLKSCSGDASSDVVCKLPLGTGSLTLKALSFPLSAGSVSIPVETKLSALIPASLAKTSNHITATSDTGDKLFCLDVNTAKQELEVADRPDCSQSACDVNCECSYVKCSDQVDACLAVDACAASQDCAFTCGCGDGACLLKCAAQSPSLKALTLAKCITANCDGAAKQELEVADRPDCSQSACDANCECSYVKCSDEVDACLAVDACAASQDCAFTCGCGDGACLLKCAAQSPSLKALTLAKCITANCDGSSVQV